MRIKSSDIAQELYDRGYVKQTVFRFPTFGVATFKDSNTGNLCMLIEGISENSFTDEALDVAGHPLTFLNTGRMHKSESLKEEFQNKPIDPR